MAAAVASAADHRRGHRARPDRRGADLRRRLRLDLGCCRPPPQHTRTPRQGPRGPLADALARLGHRGPARCGRRRPLAARAAVRARCRARPRAAAGAAAGQAQAWQRSPLPGQLVRAVQAVRGARRQRRSPGRGALARHPPGQRQPGPGSADAEVRLARRHRVPLPDRRGDRRGPAPPGLDGHATPVRAGLHRDPAAETGGRKGSR